MWCLISQPIICALEKLIRAIIASLWPFRFWIRLSTFLHVVEQLADKSEGIHDSSCFPAGKVNNSDRKSAYHTAFREHRARRGPFVLGWTGRGLPCRLAWGTLVGKHRPGDPAAFAQ